MTQFFKVKGKIKLFFSFLLAVILTLGLSLSLQSVLASLIESTGTSVHIGSTSYNLTDGQNLLWGELGATSGGTGSFILLQKAGADKFRVDHAGNVIASGNITAAGQNVCRQDGTYCPVAAVEVDAVIGNEVTNATNATLSRSGSGTALSPYTLGLNLGNANAWSALQTYGAGQTISGGNLTFSQTASSFFYVDSNQGVQLRIDADNNTTDEFAINNGANAKVFSVDESGNVTATAFIYSSDQSLKKNIKTVPNALESILKLRGVEFNWRAGGAESLGVVAQEVEKVYPQLVRTDGRTGLKSVEYGNLVAPIIEAIKEQQKQIEELKKQINELQGQINGFKK